jgi:hypothetical protein
MRSGVSLLREREDRQDVQLPFVVEAMTGPAERDDAIHHVTSAEALVDDVSGVAGAVEADAASLLVDLAALNR